MQSGASVLLVGDTGFEPVRRAFRESGSHPAIMASEQVLCRTVAWDLAGHNWTRITSRIAHRSHGTAGEVWLEERIAEASGTCGSCPTGAIRRLTLGQTPCATTHRRRSTRRPTPRC